MRTDKYLSTLEYIIIIYRVKLVFQLQLKSNRHKFVYFLHSYNYINIIKQELIVPWLRTASSVTIYEHFILVLVLSKIRKIYTFSFPDVRQRQHLNPIISRP